MNHPVDLLAAAIAEAAPNIAKITTDDLDRPTPCEGWDLRALLNHMYSRIALSTMAARLEPVPDFDSIEFDRVGDDPVGVFNTLTTELVAAWRAADDFETERVTPLGSIPAEGVLLFGAQDVFIHAWDIATTLGNEPELSSEMIEIFTATHQQSVDEQTRSMFFSDEVAVPADATPLDKLVAFLGRRP